MYGIFGGQCRACSMQNAKMYLFQKRQKDWGRMVKRRIESEAVYRVISAHWPMHVTEIAEKMGMHGSERAASISHLCYHVRALVKRGLVRSKKVGKALVVWPSEVENLKAMRALFG